MLTICSIFITSFTNKSWLLVIYFVVFTGKSTYPLKTTIFLKQVLSMVLILTEPCVNECLDCSFPHTLPLVAFYLEKKTKQKPRHNIADTAVMS